jgi:hypothetical protein
LEECPPSCAPKKKYAALPFLFAIVAPPCNVKKRYYLTHMLCMGEILYQDTLFLSISIFNIGYYLYLIINECVLI